MIQSLNYFKEIFIWLLFISVMLFSNGNESRAETGKITPYHGLAHNYECRSLNLSQSNVIGYMDYEIGQDTVSARVLYRSDGAKGTISLRLMRQDAEVLRKEIDALVRKQRTSPIRFQVRTTKNGECEFYQVSG